MGKGFWDGRDFVSLYLSKMDKGTQQRIYGRAEVFHVKGKCFYHVKRTREVRKDQLHERCREEPGTKEPLK